MAKCEVLGCGKEATNFQATEGEKRSHAWCDGHLKQGGINLDGANNMEDPPQRLPQNVKAEAEPPPARK